MTRYAEVLSLDAAIAEHEILVHTINECDADPADDYIRIRIAALSDAIEREDDLVFVL